MFARKLLVKLYIYYTHNKKKIKKKKNAVYVKDILIKNKKN